MVSETLEQKLSTYSEKFLTELKNIESNSLLHTEDFGWDNFRYQSLFYRLAHIERYAQDGLYVLHITCFPHHNCLLPIFGMDIVGNIKQNKVMAAFMDCSPILIATEWHQTTFKNYHQIPDWGHIFSDNFIAIRPDTDEVDVFCELGYSVFRDHLHQIQQPTYYTNDERKIDKIIKAQNKYCSNQAKNKRTFGVLKKKIGEKRAKYFMEQILFPKIPI